MKINDQGFSERLPGAAKTASVDQTAVTGSNGRTNAQPSTDTVQLSKLAAKLQKVSAGDSTRAARVSAIAAAVRNNTFEINPARISSAIVSEGIQRTSR